jgi:hypothetical protein
MSDEFRRDDAGPWQCVHCAARFTAPLLFCPSCGANQRAIPPRREAPGETGPDAQYVPRRRFLDRWRAFLGATGLGAGNGYAFDYGPVDEDRGVPRPRWLRRIAWGALAASAFVFIAYAILPDDSVIGSMSISSAPSTEGSVQASQDSLSDPDTALSMSRPGLGLPGDTTDAVAQDLAADKNIPADRASPPPMKGRANARVDANVDRQLATVRADLGRNSLWPAHRAMRSALAMQPGNDDAQVLSAELASRERERNALLGHAQLCARRGEWVCVREYAGRAARVDTSSVEARRLLARASGGHTVVVARRGPPTPPELFGRFKHWLALQRARLSRPLASSN